MTRELSLGVAGLSKVYRNFLRKETEALRDIDIEVPRGEFVSIIGPSGCGKSTLLRLISGLERPTSGEVRFGPGYGRGDIGFVFQNAVLLPWKTVFENIAFPLKIKKIPLEENREHLDALIELVGLSDFRNALPHELSGGMKQRVSIARALSCSPPLLLMDEPFGALDAITRDTMNMELLRIWSDTQKTVLFVTHGIDEAVFLSDRVLVLSPRPGTLRKVLTVDLPRPRTQEMRLLPIFNEYCRALREVIG